MSQEDEDNKAGFMLFLALVFVISAGIVIAARQGSSSSSNSPSLSPSRSPSSSGFTSDIKVPKNKIR